MLEPLVLDGNTGSLAAEGGQASDILTLEGEDTDAIIHAQPRVRVRGHIHVKGGWYLT